MTKAMIAAVMWKGWRPRVAFGIEALAAFANATISGCGRSAVLVSCGTNSVATKEGDLRPPLV